MNFKKSVLFFLTFVLLVSNSGVAFSVHYCGGEIVSVSSIYSMDNDICKIPIEEVEKQYYSENTDNHFKCCDDEVKCCDDEVISLQDKSDTVVVKVFSFNVDQFFFFEEWKPLVFLTDVITIKNQSLAYYCDVNAPPLFKLYCQYTLYT